MTAGLLPPQLEDRVGRDLVMLAALRRGARAGAVAARTGYHRDARCERLARPRTRRHRCRRARMVGTRARRLVRTPGGDHPRRAHAPVTPIAYDDVPMTDPLSERAAVLFAADLVADRVPSIRAIRGMLHVGQPRAQRLGEYLAVVAEAHGGNLAV